MRRRGGSLAARTRGGRPTRGAAEEGALVVNRTRAWRRLPLLGDAIGAVEVGAWYGTWASMDQLARAGPNEQQHFSFI
jgi:hypothetical protein